ncbi:MAG: pantoate--beta-alanine ligase [Candidatus Margulisbacteria bacterium]|nr:pantoate--beta-alanine ligase [Candidatus Margulisiibacteriota bacterium]
MKVIKTLKAMSAYTSKVRAAGKTIGFVPTMGYLHDGHLSLVEAAKNKAEVVIVSIFVNPTQFAAGEDLVTYPRNLKKDKKALSNFDIDVLFLPSAEEMYPQGYKTFVQVEDLGKNLCGRSRPDHFRGVTTVVAKLFNIVAPHFAFFGQKDFQQLVIIKRMVKDLNVPVEIISLPTVREYDGLAMSSRNKYLDKKQRQAAPVLYQSLLQAKEAIRSGEKDLHKVLAKIRSVIGKQPGIRIDYAAAVDPETLVEAKTAKSPLLLALAAYVGRARLIDNILL